MAKRIKLQPVATKSEALKIIDDIARLEIARQAKDAHMKEQILDIQEGIGKEIELIGEQIVMLMDRVEPFIQKHQNELFKPGQREGETALATFGVRLGNPTVAKDKGWTWDAMAMEFNAREDLRKFSRQKLSVDKDAILKAWREGDGAFQTAHDNFGVHVTQSEVAWVQPKADEVAG